MGQSSETAQAGSGKAIGSPDPPQFSVESRSTIRDSAPKWVSQQLSRAIRRRSTHPSVEILIGLFGATTSLVLGYFLRAEPGGTEPLFAVFPVVMLVTFFGGPLAGWTTLAGGLAGAWYIFVGHQFSFVLLPLQERAVFAAALVAVFMLGVSSAVRSSLIALGAVTDKLTDANCHLNAAMLELKLAQTTLARSEEEFRISFEASTVGKLQVDPDTGLIIRANRAFAHMLGYEPEDLAGQSGWELTWPEDRWSEKPNYTRYFEGKTGAHVREKRYTRKDGTPVWARMSATLAKFPDSGRPDIIIAVIEDIDERHAVQELLQATMLDLEGVVKERTAALVQRDLLLREVYHRVKNNLQLVDSILVMQAKRLSDPEAKNALASLRGRIYALGLVHHQLMGSANLQTFDVAPFLQELAANIQDAGAMLRVSLSVNAEPLDVGLDFAIPLGLLVTELVTNAMKHAFPSGEGHIDVSLSRNDDGTFDLVVSDDGTGYDCAAGPESVSTGGLGAKLIVGLVSQLKATMNIQSDHGTRAEIHIAAAA